MSLNEEQVRLVHSFLDSFPASTVSTDEAGTTLVSYANATSPDQGQVWGILQTVLCWIRDGRFSPQAGPAGPSGPPGAHTDVRRPMVNFKWTRRLTKLRYEEVRPFISQFRTYIETMGLNDREAYMMLVQHCDQHPLLFVEALPDTISVLDMLTRLETHCKPTQSTQFRQLLAMRQKKGESIADYTLRFDHAALTSGANQARKKEAYLESLHTSWKVMARSMAVMDATLTFDDLKQRLMEVAGTSDNDAMELDFLDRQEGGLVLDQVQVDSRGQIKFPVDFNRMQELLSTIETSVAKNTWLANKLRSIIASKGDGKHKKRGFTGRRPNRFTRFKHAAMDQEGQEGGEGLFAEEWESVGSQGSWEGQDLWDPQDAKLCSVDAVKGKPNVQDDKEVVNELLTQMSETKAQTDLWMQEIQTALQELQDIRVPQEADGKGASTSLASLTCSAALPHTQKKRSIQLPVYIDDHRMFALLDSGASDNFISASYLQTRGLDGTCSKLPTPLTCKLGEGETKVLQSVALQLKVLNHTISTEFYVLKGKMSQPLILGLTFMEQNDVCINFGNRKVTLGDELIACARCRVQEKEVTEIRVKGVPKGAKHPKMYKHGMGFLSQQTHKLHPGEKITVNMRVALEPMGPLTLTPRESLSAAGLAITHLCMDTNQLSVEVRNYTPSNVVFRPGSLLGYINYAGSKN